MAKARELGGSFTEPANTGKPRQIPAPDSQALFSGPMGGEPFVPAGYGGGAELGQVVASTRRIETTGWRKAVAVMTSGLIKPGPSASQIGYLYVILNSVK